MSGQTSTTRIEHRAETREAGTVHWITVSNPARLNVVQRAAAQALRDVVETAGADPAARAIVLAGAGDRAWIGGADIAEMAALEAGTAREFIDTLSAACRALREAPVPVLAPIRGYCLGAGLELAACCDLRLAARDARFGMPEVRVGLPSVIEAALLPRLIGAGRARDLVLTGRLIDAQAAAAMGLVEPPVDPAELEARLEERLRAILDAAPGAVRAQKALCNAWDELPLGEAVERGARCFAEAWRGDEPREYLQRFLARRRRADRGD